jgi:hypothetical protein
MTTKLMTRDEAPRIAADIVSAGAIGKGGLFEPEFRTGV